MTSAHGDKRRDKRFATDGERAVAASWGTFSLWSGGVNVTAFSDGQETHTSVNWYLLPPLEWFAERWDPLLHEERLPCRVAGDDDAASLARTALPRYAAHEAWERDWQEWWHSSSAPCPPRSPPTMCVERRATAFAAGPL